MTDNVQLKQDLPKRFYKSVKLASSDDGFAVLLDDKPLLTPGRTKLILPNEELAEALRAEWDAQEQQIDPAKMPMTKLVNSAIDLVTAKREQVLDETAKYVASDLICYRAKDPEDLVKKQIDAWNPVIDWAANALQIDFETTKGVTYVEQPKNAIPQARRAMEDMDHFALMAVHNMTTLTGSLLLTLAHIAGNVDALTAWQFAHIEEDWQVSRWGEDAEAKQMRAFKWREMEASSQLYALVKA